MRQVKKTALRAVRNVARSPLRAGMMAALLAVGISLALVMVTVDHALADRLDQIKANVGTEVSVSPAGSGGRGFFNGQSQQYLSAGDVAKIAALPHVASVSNTIEQFSVQTNLTAAARQGFGGGRFAQGGATGTGGNTTGGATAAGDGGTFIPTTGIDASGPLQLTGGGSATVSAGRGFTADEANGDVAIVGQQLATANSLQVGSTFTLQNETIQVVGIFDSGTLFGDNGIYLPLATAQRLFGQEGQVSTAIAQVDSADNVASVADSIRSTLGTDNVDVTTSTDQFDRISGSLAGALHSSQVALIASLVASVAVILFATALVTRQRVREIGILKAIGASGWNVGLQFGVESLAVAAVAAVVGAAITFPTAQWVANGLVSGATGGGGFPGGGGGGIQIGAAAGSTINRVSVAVTPAVFLYAVALAVVLALLASVVPAWRVSTVRPAEVLRNGYE